MFITKGGFHYIRFINDCFCCFQQIKCGNFTSALVWNWWLTAPKGKQRQYVHTLSKVYMVYIWTLNFILHCSFPVGKLSVGASKDLLIFSSLAWLCTHAAKTVCSTYVQYSCVKSLSNILFFPLCPGFAPLLQPVLLPVSELPESVADRVLETIIIIIC